MGEIRFKRDMDTLLNIRKKCETAKEWTAEYYCEYLLKLYMAFDKIEKTGMLFHIRQIISPAFPLVVRYFSNRVIEYLNPSSEEDKADILKDIERSVVKFSGVFEAITQFTNGVDRILFQTAPIDTGRYAATKLCVYYSEVLNCMADIFRNTATSEYAFCVYPSLNSRAETVLLFSTMKNSGKVGIIRVPEKDIADVNYLRVMLLHEFYHIIPGELRLRRERAIKFMTILLYDVSERLLQETGMSELVHPQKMDFFLFGDLKKRVETELNPMGDNERCFYSREIKSYFADMLYSHFQSFQGITHREIFDGLYDASQIQNFDEYERIMEGIKKFRNRLINNAFAIIVGGDIIKVCDFYMGIFREVYADLLSVISLRLEVNEYFEMFRCMSPISETDDELVYLYVRIFLVKECMCADIEMESDEYAAYFSRWSNWQKGGNCQGEENSIISDVLRFEDKLNRSGDEEKDENGISSRHKWGVIPNKRILHSYAEYFKKCREEFVQFEKKNYKKFETFRKKFNISGNGPDGGLNKSISLREWEGIAWNDMAD